MLGWAKVSNLMGFFHNFLNSCLGLGSVNKLQD